MTNAYYLDQSSILDCQIPKRNKTFRGLKAKTPNCLLKIIQYKTIPPIQISVGNHRRGMFWYKRFSFN